MFDSCIIDDVALFEKCSAASGDICNTGVPFERVREVIAAWKTIRENHKEEPTREVRGVGGKALVQATRDPIGGRRERKTTPLVTRHNPAQ
jgi:hypothetical protein